MGQVASITKMLNDLKWPSLQKHHHENSLTSYMCFINFYTKTPCTILLKYPHITNIVQTIKLIITISYT